MPLENLIHSLTASRTFFSVPFLCVIPSSCSFPFSFQFALYSPPDPLRNQGIILKMWVSGIGVQNIKNKTNSKTNTTSSTPLPHTSPLISHPCQQDLNHSLLSLIKCSFFPCAAHNQFPQLPPESREYLVIVTAISDNLDHMGDLYELQKNSYSGLSRTCTHLTESRNHARIASKHRKTGKRFITWIVN